MSLSVFIVSFIAGAAAALGLGGGTFLIIYLTVFAGTAQSAAQGINLIFFIPSAAAAVWLHSRGGLVDWKKALPAAAAGVLSAALCSFAANNIDPVRMRRLFGAFILLAGMKMLAEKNEKRR